MNKNATSEKRDIVASIETMPKCTKEEHYQTAMNTVVNHKTQPVSRRTIPVIKQHFQAGA